MLPIDPCYNTSMRDTLLTLGLTDNEVDIYLSLMDIGSGTAYDVIKKSGLHRNSVYSSLQGLVKKKLVTQVERNKKQYFEPVDPQRILLLEEAHMERVKELVPQLKAMYNTRPTEIIVHEGEREYRDFWMNIAKTAPKGTINYVMPSMSKKWWDLMGKDTKKFLRYHVENQIKLKMIVFSKEEIELEHLKTHPELIEMRFIDRPHEPSGNLAIWGDICYVQTVDDVPVLIEIKNKAIWNVFKQHFDLLWDIGKPIKPE